MSSRRSSLDRNTPLPRPHQASVTPRTAMPTTASASKSGACAPLRTARPGHLATSSAAAWTWTRQRPPTTATGKTWVSWWPGLALNSCQQ